MTNRIVEAKIILLFWLLSASVASYSLISDALTLSSEGIEYANSTQSYNFDPNGAIIPEIQPTPTEGDED